MIVGQKLGVDALSAISTFFPLLFFLISFVVGIGSEISIFIGQSFSGGNLIKTKGIVGVTIAFTTIVSTVVAIFGSVFNENILNWMGTLMITYQIKVIYEQIVQFPLRVFIIHNVTQIIITIHTVILHLFLK
ncbi:MATE family efflux transporter [Lysinibacillus fusiformis]|uniref:MATE family efflux transporter n=1 Tax=Lysinibacillus fusiformis TaxID=28031 RepID=UPI0013B424E2|nr:MATE family efflux transporter [Lysinibacillus fusiformis]